MAQEKVVLTPLGFGLRSNIQGQIGQRIYRSLTCFPHITTGVDLPELGDAWGAQPDGYTNAALICKEISLRYINDDNHAGCEYTCNYDSQDDRVVSEDPIKDLGAAMSISCGASFDSYTIDPSVDGAAKMYVNYGGAWQEIKAPQTICKLSPTVQISTTARIVDTADNIIAKSSLCGHVNSAAMWGCAIGTVLYQGASATPVQGETESGTLRLEHNVTRNYTVRFLPGIAADTWQYVFYNGSYVKLSTSAGDAGWIKPYAYASLPQDVS